MNSAMKIILFILFVFVFGMIWNAFNIGIESMNEATTTTTELDFNYTPELNTLYHFLWYSSPLILGLIGTALYLIKFRSRGDLY
jgi:hypothetical protein